MQHTQMDDTSSTGVTVDRLITSLRVIDGKSNMSQSAIKNSAPSRSTFTILVEDVPDDTQPANDQKDTGEAAYRVLIASVVFESVVVGLPLAYGVFQDHYTRTFPSNGIAAWIGVLSSGIPFLGAPAITHCCQKFDLDVRYYTIMGWGLCIIALLTSAFCSSLTGLVVTQGLVYGIGALLVDIPVLTMVNTWFEKRRGIAYGLIFGGADLVAIAYTFLATHLLRIYDRKMTMLVLVGMVFCLAGPPMLAIRKRPVRPHERRGSTSSTSVAYAASPHRQDSWDTTTPTKRYYKRGIFYMLTAANLLQSLAFYLPFIYLPSFATDLGYSANQAALVLSMANLAQVFGEVGFGKLSDKFHVNNLVIITTTVASAATFVLWGLFAAKSMAALLMFAFLFGCFGSGFLALWARMGTLFGEKDAQMVYSTMCFGRGVGSILSGPISLSLLSHSGVAFSRIDFGAGKYAGVVVFVGAGMAASAFIGICGTLALSWNNRSQSEITIGNVLKSESGSRSSWSSK